MNWLHACYCFGAMMGPLLMWEWCLRRTRAAGRTTNKASTRWAIAARAMCIEIAWCWLQFQPQIALSGWYKRRFGQGNRRQRRIGIVALGTKLLVALLKYLTTGVPPEGTELADLINCCSLGLLLPSGQKRRSA